MMTSYEGQTAENNIDMTKLDFAFYNPAKLCTTGYVVHVRTYRAQYQLKQSDQYHFENVTFTVASTPVHHNALQPGIFPACRAPCYRFMRGLMATKIGCNASYTP